MANHSSASPQTHSAPAAGGHAAPGAHGHAHGHGPHGGHDVASEVRKYLLVFGALIIGTILTVWASYINFGTPSANIVVALVIAIIKAGLVASFFMHLIDERKLIYGVLGATAFFFVGLMYITLWSMEPISFIHLRH